jgi:hypothetical protein
MRKLPQPASVLLGIGLLLGLVLTGARETAGRGLDPAAAWRFARSGERTVAVARLKRSGLSATSTNGTDWEVQKIICGFNAVAQGDGRFVAVGESGAIGVTTNGENWRITSITTNELCGVFFEGGCFIASGCPPIREFFTSRNGFVWERHGVAANGLAARIGTILESRVTATNGAAEQGLTSIANEVRTLCRAPVSGR